jgi:hypothetical protein
MNNTTFILSSLTLVLWGFTIGACYITIRNLVDKLEEYQKRDAIIQDIVDRKMRGQEDE